ncbi:hypothetical protein INR49_011657 [Caranx melampygus]|nr:hypothetical protein INR49_011657 [Caranx melampygus]
MAAAETEKPVNDETNEEYRVTVTSKRQVVEQMNRYKDVLGTVLRGQTEVAEDTKRLLLQELLANFEAAVQDNVLVGGHTWEEAPDAEEDEDADLDSLLDDTIVETTRRRRTYPRQILPHVVHSLKAERKLMGLYEQVVKAPQVVRDPEQESIMGDLSAAAPGMVKQAIQVIKSINTLQKQAEGLCEVLNMKPSHTTLDVHREVFGPRWPIRGSADQRCCSCEEQAANQESRGGGGGRRLLRAPRQETGVRAAVTLPAATTTEEEEDAARPAARPLSRLSWRRQVPVMSDCDSSCQRSSGRNVLCDTCEGSEDEGRRMKRREKNRVAAQKSRKRQTQRADLLHQACELLEQRNRKLRREVTSLSEEQRLLTEALRAHEPLCPIMHCFLSSSSSSSSLQPDSLV